MVFYQVRGTYNHNQLIIKVNSLLLICKTLLKNLKDVSKILTEI